MRMRIFKNPPLLVLTGVLLGGGFMYFLGDSHPTEGFQRYGTYVISAMVTLIAAVLAYYGVLKNINNQRAQEDERRPKSLLAAKATLPLVLAEFIKICRRGIKISLGIDIEDLTNTELMQQVAVPEAMIVHLKECIEFADDISANRLANIIRTYQMINARLDRHLSEPRNLTKQAKHAVEWAILHGLVGDVFEFSRSDGTDTIPPTLTNPQTLHTFFTFMNLDINQYPELHKAIAERIELQNPEFQ